MKKLKNRVLVVAVIGLGIGAYLIFAYLHRARPSLGEAATFIRSVQGFIETRSQQGKSRPLSLELSELVDSGYVTRNTAKRFSGCAIAVWQEPNETQPQEMLVHLKLRDGRSIGVFADGGIQGLTP